MSEDKHGNHFEFHFHNTVGQNIGHVDTLIANFDKDMKMQTALVDNVINEEVASQDSAEQEEELNYFQPTNHLKRLLADDCISDFVSDHQYTGKWFEAFVDALMASECRDEIARDWSIRGKNDKRDLIRGYVIGCLKDAGVLNGSYQKIAEAIVGSEYYKSVNGDKNGKTFAAYLGRGKNQSFSDWIKDYVNTNRKG